MYVVIIGNAAKLMKINIFTFTALLVIAFLWVTYPSPAQTTISAELAQQSIAYIFFDVVDPNTGAKSTIQGTGFVVSPKGYILTASHLFRAWKAQRPVDKANNPIKATLRDKVGYVPESPLILNRINIGDPEQEDVALLKLPASKAYPAAPICLRQAAAAKAGDPLMAFGFPQNQNFQPVTGVLGLQNAEGGRWAAASAFAEGMSGGPVYIGETVVGLVKGGLEGTNAVQWITPIGFAATLLNNAGVQESCAPPEQPQEPAIKIILKQCYRRALFTRMHAQISTDAMFRSITKCQAALLEQIRELKDKDLQKVAMDLLETVDAIERYNPIRSSTDIDAINALKIAALHNFRQLATQTGETYPLPDRGRLAEASYFTQEEADGPLAAREVGDQHKITTIGIGAFEVDDEQDKDLLKLARLTKKQFFDYYSENNIELAYGKEVTDFTIRANILHGMNDNIDIQLEVIQVNLLKYSITISAPIKVLSEVYRSIPRAMFSVLNISPKTLTPLGTKQGSASPLATLYFEEAVRLARGRRFDASEMHFHKALQEDEKYAGAYWNLGELFKLRHDYAKETEWKARAYEIDPDYESHSLEDDLSNPLLAIKKALANLTWKKIDEGVEIRKLDVIDYNVELTAWRIDPQRFNFEVASAETAVGSKIEEFTATKKNFQLAINGSYFEIDSARKSNSRRTSNSKWKANFAY